MSRHNSLLLTVSALALIMVGAAPNTGQTAEFYKGRTVTVIVPSGSGGTFHVYGQLVQRHIARHIPGNPTTIVQNRPGAGGARAAAYMMNAAPKDGTVISELAPGSITAPLLRKMKFDATKFQFIGSTAARTYTFAVWHTTPVKTIDDVKKTRVNFGNTGKTSTGFIFPTLVNAVLGTKIKIISGYKGGGAINLAIERGEVQGRGNFYSGYTGVRPQWIRDKKIKFLLTLGPKRPEVAHIPHVRDLIKNSADRAMYDLLDVDLSVGQAFYAPPGVPKDRVAILRKAFDAMVKDPEFLADAKKRRVPITPRTAKQIQAWINVAVSTPKSTVDRLAKVLGVRK